MTGAVTPDRIVGLMDAAFQARDAEAIADFYEDDAIFANPPMWTAVGRAEIIEKLNELFATTSAIDVDYQPPAMSKEIGDYAFVHYTAVTSVSLADGTQHELRTRTTTIARRGTDGNWRYILDHNSSP